MKYISLLSACVITLGSAELSAKNIRQLSWPTGSAQVANKHLDVQVTTFSKENSRTLFAKNGNLVHKRHAIIPMQVTISNTGHHEMLLDTASIQLPLVSTQEMVSILSKKSMIPAFVASTSLSIAGLGLGIIGGVFTFVTICFPNPVTVSVSAATVLGSSACLVSALKVIPEQQSDMHEYNSSLPYTLEQLMLPEQAIIKPNESVSGIVFVKQRDYRHDFDITLTNANNPSETFATHVQLA